MFEFLNHLDFWVTFAAIGVTLYAVLISPHRKKQRKAKRAEERRLAAIAASSEVSAPSSPEPVQAAVSSQPLLRERVVQASNWALPDDDALLPAPRWLHLLNERPDDVPHVMLIAPSRCGKTTFATALLSRRKGKLIVLTPKPEDRWGGLPSRLTIDDNGKFATIIRAFSVLLVEVQRRLVATKRGDVPGETLTIVIDDAPALISLAGKDASDVVKLVARLGASLRVRLVLISQTTRVKSLGLEGEGDVLDNFALIRLTPASDDSPRTANLTWGQTDQQPLDLKLVPTLATQADLNQAGWEIPRAAHRIMYETEILPEETGNEAEAISSWAHFPTKAPIEAMPETPEMHIATPEIERNALLQDETDEIAVMALAVAKMVAAGKCNETEGIRIVFGVGPGANARYQAARTALKQAQDRLQHLQIPT